MKEKFIYLKSLGLSLPEIARSLNISLSACKRLSVNHADEVNSLVSLVNSNADKKIELRLNSFLGFIGNQIDFLQNEVLLHKEIYMPYDKLIDNIGKLLNQFAKAALLKKSFKNNSPDEIFQDDDNSVYQEFTSLSSQICASSNVSDEKQHINNLNNNSAVRNNVNVSDNSLSGIREDSYSQSSVSNSKQAPDKNSNKNSKNTNSESVNINNEVSDVILQDSEKIKMLKRINMAKRNDGKT